MSFDNHGECIYRKTPFAGFSLGSRRTDPQFVGRLAEKRVELGRGVEQPLHISTPIILLLNQ